MTTKHGLYQSLAVLLLLFSVKMALAAIPSTLNYQGHLTDTAGVPVDGPVNIVFAIYNVDAGGIALWADTLTVTVTQGIFSVELGRPPNPFPLGLFDIPLWLGLTVDSDAEMVPRRPISSVGYSFKAADADTLEGVSASSLDQSAHVIDTSNPHSVTTAQIGAISGADLAVHAGSSSVHHAKTSTFPELSGLIADAQIPVRIARDDEIMPTVLANDGPGSLLNADLLDGFTASAFMSSGADLWVNTTGDTMTGALTLPVNGLDVGGGQLRAAAGNIGIGTKTPKQRLHVDGDYYGRGHLYLYAFQGDGSSGTAYVQARDDSGTTSLDMRLRTQSTGTVIDAMTLSSTGDVGIGTTSPTAKLDVAGAAQVSGNLNVASAANVSGNLGVAGAADVTGNLIVSGRMRGAARGTAIRTGIPACGSVGVITLQTTCTTNVCLPIIPPIFFGCNGNCTDLAPATCPLPILGYLVAP